MNHLDEGTIHAWLDGALDATQSAEIDAHVKTCGECSAKVAEARGLIAASSRILVSLDDVPANVIPKKAPAAPTRPRRMAPWVSGLAAAAILLTLWRTSGVEQPAARSEIKVPDIKVVTGLPEPTLTELKVDVTPPPPATVVPPAAEQRQTRVANSPRGADGRAAAGAGTGGGLATGAAGDLASAQSAAPVAGDRALRREASDEARRALIPAPASPIAEAALADVADAPKRLSGCYLLPGQERNATEALATAVGGAAGAVAKTTARTRAAAAPTATAPSAQTARSDAAVPAAVVRLDTTAAAPRGFQLRDARSESQRGTWEPINRDSVRVIVPAVGTFTFAVYEKIACPER